MEGWHGGIEKLDPGWRQFSGPNPYQENLTRIFGSKAGPQVMQFPGYGPQCYGGNPWSYRQPVNVGDQTWTRISPFIIEAGPTYTNGRGCYPYC